MQCNFEAIKVVGIRNTSTEMAVGTTIILIVYQQSNQIERSRYISIGRVKVIKKNMATLRKYLILFLLIIAASKCSYQDQYIIHNNGAYQTKVEGDSMIKTKNNGKYYDFFLEKFDSTIVVYFGDEEKYFHLLKYDTITKKGVYKIYYEDKLAFRYEVLKNAPQGIGKMYDVSNGELILVGVFNDSRLDGPLLRYDEDGEVIYFAKFNNGKFQKFWYHHAAIRNSSRKQLSRKTTNPLIVPITEM